jgi:hypothetical protein
MNFFYTSFPFFIIFTTNEKPLRFPENNGIFFSVHQTEPKGGGEESSVFAELFLKGKILLEFTIDKKNQACQPSTTFFGGSVW